MTIKETINFGTQKLKASKSAGLDAEVLLGYVLKKGRAWLYSHRDDILTSDQIRRYQELILKRRKGFPVAYLTHHKEFFGLDFYVDENVLIPRPESEILVEEALSYCSSTATYKQCLRGTARTKKILSSRPSVAASNGKFNILDLGTGSGCIIIALAASSKQQTANSKYYATDISNETLKIARKNAEKHQAKIKFIKSDLFTSIPKKLKFDLIIVNLPYLDLKWIDKNLKFEPRAALNGGIDGLAIIENFFKQAKNYLNKKSVVLIEIDPRQVKKIKELSEKYLPRKRVWFKKDLSRLDRVAILS